MLIAKVNEFEISYDSYRAELIDVMKDLKLEQPNINCKNKALEKLIDGVLLLTEAKKSEIKVSQDEIEASLLDYMVEFNSKEEFENTLSKNNISVEELKEKLRNKLLIKKYIKEKIDNNFKITERKLQEIYDENKELLMIGKQVRVSHILIKKEVGALKAKEIRKKIKTPEDFYRFVETCSNCPSCQQSGDLGYISEGKMVKEFDEVAFKLPVNSISDPIETVFGFHIIMITDIIEKHIPTFENIKERLAKRLKDIDFQLKLLNHLKFLKEKADIIIYHNNID